MRYRDGQEMHLGDRMVLWDGSEGTIVCSMDTHEYSPDYPREHWAYLVQGVLILSENPDLVRCIGTEGEMRLLARGKIMILAEMIPPKKPMRGVQ